MWRKGLLAAVAVAFAVSAGCTSGGDDDDDDDGGSGNTLVTGTVRDDADGPLEGATVTEVLSGTDDTTGADGVYQLLLASNAQAYLLREAPDYYPFQVAAFVPPGGFSLDIGGPTSAEVSGIGGILGVTIDAADGIVATQLNGVGTTGGFMVTISATADGSFVFGAGGAPTAGNTTVDGEEPLVAYYNVAVGTTTVTVTEPGGWTCTETAPIGTYRVDAGTITQLQFDCSN